MVPILALVSAAGLSDLRQRRIPNWLVALTLVVSLATHGLRAGVGGLLESAAGMAAGLVLLFPLFVIRAMGAGDVKSFSALGAAVTYRSVPALLVLTLVFSAVLAAIEVVRHRACLRTLRNVRALVCAWAQGRQPAMGVDHPDAVLVPFTFAAALATWLVLLLGGH
jgi:prepilin peptidase CpaA